MTLSVNTVTFCLLSFEGPDRYAQAGGLGVRITHLAETLADQGFETHLFFVGDPTLPGLETRRDGRLILHRWCQWISAYHPVGVYDGEEEKLVDLNASLPPFLIDQVIRPAISAGRLVVILAEEWHTAEMMVLLHEQLESIGLRHRCVMLWNANNTMSFHRLEWSRLDAVVQLTTVSRYMKHLMWAMNLNPLVIPNGIPSDLLLPVDQDQILALRSNLAPDPQTVMLFKAGRFDPAKRWLMAIEAAAKLKEAGCQVAFPLRGGIEEHGFEVFARARELGLTISNVSGQPNSGDDVVQLINSAPRADIYNLDFFMTQEMLRPFYAAADAVLANSGHEPFGLVGLEAMAAGGVVYTGATGEEYTLGGECAVVLDTDSPDEIVSHVLELKDHPDRALAMRQSAHKRAATFTWEKISRILLDKVKFVARSSGALPQANGFSSGQLARDVLIYTAVHQPRRFPLPVEPIYSGLNGAGVSPRIFDESLAKNYFRAVAASCYYPATSSLHKLLDGGLHLAIGFSQAFIAQTQRWDEALLDKFRQLVSHDQVELVLIEPASSFNPIENTALIVNQIKLSARKLKEIFDKKPVAVDATDMFMSEMVYEILAQAGFKAAFLPGRSGILDWRSPTYLYHSDQKLKLLAPHHQLSDDVVFRFSDRTWAGWPLMADEYVYNIAKNAGDLVILAWDFETFGAYHPGRSGIFDFVSALTGEIQRAGLSFITPGQALQRYGERSHHVPLPPHPGSEIDGNPLISPARNGAQKQAANLLVEV